MPLRVVTCMGYLETAAFLMYRGLEGSGESKLEVVF